MSPEDEAMHEHDPERRLERRAEDPAGRPTPFVDGPTGPAPIATEYRGDPSAEGDRGGEHGAFGGFVAGTAVAGPVGGAIGGVVGATIGSAAEATSDADVRDDEIDAAEQTSESTVSNSDR